MFKKLINDEKSEEWNILMFTLITFAIYFLIFTPIVIFGMMQDPEGLEILMYQPETDAEKIVETCAQIRSVLEFVILGIILEFNRRKNSMKFKISDEKATKFLIYFCITMVIYVVLQTVGVIFS